MLFQTLGISKLEAEEIIKKMCTGTSMSYIMFCLPLVYDYGVKANFAALIRLVRKKWLLPLTNANNKHSLLYVGNLVSAIQKSINSKNAQNQLFYISDGNDISTTQLIEHIAHAYTVKVRLFYVPLVLVKFIAKLARKSSIFLRFFGSLQVSNEKLQITLDWKLPYTVESALAEIAQQEKLDSTGQ